MEKVEYIISKNIPAKAIHRVFKDNEMNQWFTLTDTIYYIKKAKFIISAWINKKCIGLACVNGDGKINLELYILVVDKNYRGKGIGHSLMDFVVKKVVKLNPYHFKLEVFEKRTEKFYSEFGFIKNKGTWLLEHKPTGNKLRERVEKFKKKG